MTGRNVRWCFVVGLSIAMAACGGVPLTHYYMLQTGPEDVAHRRAPGLIVGVDAVLVDAPYDGDRIVYRRGASSPEVGFYEYHRWAAPLHRMLPAVLAHGLEGAEGVAVVEPTDRDREYDAHLRARVLSLEEVDDADGVHAEVRLELLLRLPDGTLLWSDRLAAEVTTDAGSVSEIVTAMGEALSRALEPARDPITDALARDR